MAGRMHTAIDSRISLSGFAADVARDLALTPKRLNPKYLYDDLGSALFGAICQLPWYRITRAEKGLLARQRAAIAQSAGDSVRLVELGCGTGEKLRLLADGFVACGRRAEVHAIDISRLALDRTVHALAGTRLPVVCHNLTYEEGIARASADRAPGEAVLVLFLGSNLGNFDPPEAIELLRLIRASLLPGDHLLLGVDLVKPEADLQLAYDDPLGVTAAFNKNLLVRINRELDGEFDVEAFRHLALWNAAESRVEMHLVNAHAQTVHIRGAHMRVPFEAGETIWTESSYKYEPDQICAMAALTGFDARRQWIDPESRFALTLQYAV